MKLIYCLIITMTLLSFGSAAARIPQELSLSGTGEIHYLGFIKVYDASLFAPPDAMKKDILADDCSRCLKLDYAVNLSVDNFIEAGEKILQKQQSETILASIKPQLDLLHQNYRDVKKNDTYTLCYDAAKQQTSLNLNGNTLVTIPSTKFAAIYFGIWLGEENPIDQGLRSRLLAGLK
ncbi:MAG: hypothetical protein HKP41_04160 [Desulfobacterales bacterium]|nr:chalcone isomerase family protein [Deltaproteobacteria bacterium]MBT8361142.1 chalcone isomerase family protein [Deltaproteobacteria bacterium]NNK93527.1 hypothetical protein [Desulfobacterales bacterium]